jgi:hypothetical protein
MSMTDLARHWLHLLFKLVTGPPKITEQAEDDPWRVFLKALGED